MAVEILLVQSNPAMREGRVAEWFAADGERVTEGQPLFSLSSDNATDQVEAPATGTLKINARIGQTYEIGTVLGYIEQV